MTRIKEVIKRRSEEGEKDKCKYFYDTFSELTIKEISVDFINWINREGWVNCDTQIRTDLWTRHDEPYLTTPELFDLFNNSK